MVQTHQTHMCIINILAHVGTYRQNHRPRIAYRQDSEESLFCAARWQCYAARFSSLMKSHAFFFVQRFFGNNNHVGDSSNRSYWECVCMWLRPRRRWRRWWWWGWLWWLASMSWRCGLFEDVSMLIWPTLECVTFAVIENVVDALHTERTWIKVW